MYNGSNYEHNGNCPSCTDDGNPFELTRLTTGRITCDSLTGVADTITQGKHTKPCTPNKCDSEVPDTSIYTNCIDSDASSCILNGNTFTKSGKNTRKYEVYDASSLNGQSNIEVNLDCSIDCTKPSPPTDLTSEKKTANTITITWKVGSNGDTTVDGYDIFCNESKHNISVVRENIEYIYTLTELLPSSTYNIKVQKITSPEFMELFSNEIKVVTDLPACDQSQYNYSFIHNEITYTNLASVPCESTNCGNMNVTKVYSPNNCIGSRANETVTKNCGYCVSTTGRNKFFHILFHDTNDVIDTSGISDWNNTLIYQFRFLVSGDIAGYQMNVGKTPYDMNNLGEYHKEFVTFELAKCYQCNRDKVLQVILTKHGGQVKSYTNGDLYLFGGHTKLAYHQHRVIIPYNDVMFIEHELERVVGFGDTSAIYYIKETTGSTYAKVDRSNSNLNESSLTWVSDRDSATQFVITNDGLLLQESRNVLKQGPNSWMKMLKT
jgi:hypothetical protein